MFNSRMVRAVDQTLYGYGEDVNIVTAEYKGMNMVSYNKERFCVRAFVDTITGYAITTAPRVVIAGASVTGVLLAIFG